MCLPTFSFIFSNSLSSTAARGFFLNCNTNHVLSQLQSLQWFPMALGQSVSSSVRLMSITSTASSPIAQNRPHPIRLCCSHIAAHSQPPWHFRPSWLQLSLFSHGIHCILFFTQRTPTHPSIPSPNVTSRRLSWPPPGRTSHCVLHSLYNTLAGILDLWGLWGPEKVK